MARSAPRPPFGLPELTVAVRTSLLSSRKAGKTRVFTPVRESSGESRISPKSAIESEAIVADINAMPAEIVAMARKVIAD
jgi:hypothetical protein